MKYKKKILIILGLVALVSTVLISSFARYGFNHVWNYYLESRGFYLTSDYLGNNKKNINTLWDGGSVHLNINNYANNNLITDFDIRYDITCTVLNNDPYVCRINGTNNSKVSMTLSSNSRCVNNIDSEDVSLLGKSECEMGGYEWNNLAVSQDVYFDVSTLNESDINTANIRITVESTSPYKKTMNGTFSLFRNNQIEGEITKQIDDNELYDDLIITNSYNIRKCVLVSFDSSTRSVNKENNFISPTVDNDGYINSFKIIIDSKANKKIRFYNKDLSINYNIDDFTISESSGCF